MTDATFARLVKHQPELAARLADYHLSFDLGGRTYSHTIRHTTYNGAHAAMQRWSDDIEDEVNAERRSRGLGLILTYNCAVRKIERIEPDVLAHMAQARAHGRTTIGVKVSA